MFIDTAEMETESLRQGDILANITFPQLVTKKTAFLGAASLNRIGDPAFRFDREEEIPFAPDAEVVRDLPMFTCQVPARICFGAVISMCCDIAPRDGGRPDALMISFARLIPIARGILRNQDALADLRRNSDPRVPGAPFLNFFHILENQRLQNSEWVVDFGQVFSVPSSEYPSLLERKTLQMDDDTRIRFKIRLASSFARLMPEEEALNHPWLRDPPEPA